MDNLFFEQKPRHGRIKDFEEIFPTKMAGSMSLSLSLNKSKSLFLLSK